MTRAPVTRRDFTRSAFAFALPSPTPIQWISQHIPTGEQQLSWAAPGTPLNMGSLLKPFLLLSYRATHKTFPTFHCLGSRSGCWRASGHGDQDAIAALANSCNTYFLKLASAIDPAALESTCACYSLSSNDTCDPAQLIGLNGGWPQSPPSVVRAFSLLASKNRDSAARPIFSGMQRCAASGTARDTGFPCYAKTGTAPCTHTPAASGDGFALAIYPIDQPRRVLLVQHHNVPGAVAARDLKRFAQFAS